MMKSTSNGSSLNLENFISLSLDPKIVKIIIKNFYWHLQTFFYFWHVLIYFLTLLCLECLKCDRDVHWNNFFINQFADSHAPFALASLSKQKISFLHFFYFFSLFSLSLSRTPVSGRKKTFFFFLLKYFFKSKFLSILHGFRAMCRVKLHAHATYLHFCDSFVRKFCEFTGEIVKKISYLRLKTSSNKFSLRSLLSTLNKNSFFADMNFVYVERPSESERERVKEENSGGGRSSNLKNTLC